MECQGCEELRRQVQDLRQIVETQCQCDTEVRLASTHISERTQVEIDRILLDSRQKTEKFEELYHKVMSEKCQLADDNVNLKRQLNEKLDEVTVLSEQNGVYASDFQMERADRERTHGRLVEVEQQLAAASQRVAELEDEKQRLQMAVATLRHQQAAAGLRLNHGASIYGSSAAATGGARPPPYAMSTYNIFNQPMPHGSSGNRGTGDHRPSLYHAGGGFDVCDGPDSIKSDGVALGYGKETNRAAALYHPV